MSIWIHSRLLQNSTHLLRDSAISSSEHSSAAAPSVTAHYWQSVPTATPPLRVDEGKAVALNFDAHFARNTTQRSYMLSSIPRLSSRSPPRGALVVARLHRAPHAALSDSSHIGNCHGKSELLVWAVWADRLGGRHGAIRISASGGEDGRVESGALAAAAWLLLLGCTAWIRALSRRRSRRPWRGMDRIRMRTCGLPSSCASAPCFSAPSPTAWRLPGGALRWLLPPLLVVRA